MTRQCIFCGNKPVTNEHVFGTWLSPLFPAPTAKQMFIDRETFVKGQSTNITRRYPLNIDLQVKQVCSSCNSGWMSNLENEVMAILPEIFNGTKSSITYDEQSILASWATKTAITIQYTDKRPLVPIRRRKWLLNNRTPPPDTSVWIARYDGEGLATVISKDLFVEGNAKSLSHPNGQVVLFSIGSVFFVVLCLYLKNAEYRLEFPTSIEKHLFQIWPSKGQDVNWPLNGLDDSTRVDLYDIKKWDFILRFYLLPKPT
ncbi:MAG: hypothetical protein GY861_07565 [bacterium]|nr:hypothetical protein [bacterium]